jgi:hypothetical protein
MTIWQILSIGFTGFQFAITIPKVNRSKLEEVLSLVMLACFIFYAVNINWGRFFILLGYVSFVFILFSGKSLRSVFIALAGLVVSFKEFYLGYAIIQTVIIYWLLIKYKSNPMRLETRYYVICIACEVIYLSFGSVSFLWSLFFLTSRFYFYEFLKLQLVSGRAEV